ncbi:MAG: undecaprenyl-diphosphatase [Alphaproteobacteria bacterium 32-64-14]|nr:MAG: undecaprenyl-diphosphatase [Alphaproteobacteria bacterium 32-64-14]
MDTITFLQAILIGLVEGLTEFIPVSSTAHILLTQAALDLRGEFWSMFAVVIQLGAILAVVVVYFQRLLNVVINLPKEPAARRFALSVIIACLPAVIAAALLGSEIKKAFDNLALICWSLVVGGVVLLVIDKLAPKPVNGDAMKLPLWKTAVIGIAQIASLFPGVSRSGSTIVASMLLKIEKRAAAEFSFFLAIPIMIGAFGKDLWDHRDNLSMDDMGVVAVGFIASFVFGFLAIKVMLDYVQKRGFGLFGWWRIVIGGAGLIAIYFYGFGQGYVPPA